MTDQVLDILKLVLLALLYLFFARVLWAVWSEVRQPNVRAAAERAAAERPPEDGTPTAGTPWRTNPNQKPPAAPRGRRGVPARLVVLEPKERRGTAFPITAEPIKIGRDTHNTVVIPDDAFVSALHATVAFHLDRVVVDDVASKNGTFLNGTRVLDQRTVSIGDRIQVGNTILEAQ